MFFNRIEQLARGFAAGKAEIPEESDTEGSVAYYWLEKLWEEVRAECNHRRPELGLSAMVSPAEVKSDEYLNQVLEKIRRDRSIAFEGWWLGHDNVAYIKQFASHAEVERARELLAMVDFADGNQRGSVTYNLPPVEGENEISDEIPDVRLRRNLRARQNHAKALTVRCDWLDAFAKAEGIQVGLIH